MENPVIKTDLAELLNKLDRRFDKLDERLDKIDDRLNRLEIGQAEIKGDIKALDTKVDQLDKRVGNQEFTNRGVLVGLIIVILGGAAKFFGIVGNP
jgi:predicted nuclease with TOPRIM domain